MLEKLMEQCRWMKQWKYTGALRSDTYPYAETSVEADIRELDLKEENVSFLNNKFIIRYQKPDGLLICKIPCRYIH